MTFDMDSKGSLQLRTITIIAFIFVAALSRLLPHPPNVSPIGGIALFGAAYFSRKWLAFVIPVAALWFSNLILDNFVYNLGGGSFTWFNSYFVWVILSVALIMTFGQFFLHKIQTKRVVIASLIASLIFFLVTNFSSWIYLDYPKNLSGLFAAYVAGIPFFWNTLAGDLFYVALLFGGFEWLRQRYPQQLSVAA